MSVVLVIVFSPLTLLVGYSEGRFYCKNPAISMLKFPWQTLGVLDLAHGRYKKIDRLNKSEECMHMHLARGCLQVIM